MGSPVSGSGSAEANDLAAGQLAQLWKNLFEVSPDAQVVCRLDGVVEQVNPRAALLLKLVPRDSDHSACIFDALLPPADQQLKDLLRRLPAHTEVLNFATVIAAGGTRGLTDLEVTPLGPARALIAFKDAGRRLRLEAHVRRLITAIDSTPEAFYITDAEMRLTFANPAFQISTGYSLEEVLGRDDAFLRAPGEQDKVEAYLAGVKEGREWTGEVWNIRKDGTRYQVETNLSPIFDMTGEFMGYVGCERDVTLRVWLQSELRMERDFIHSILTSLDGAIYTVDREFRLTHANEGWRHLPPEHGGIHMDGPPEPGRSLFDYIRVPERSAELRAIFQQVLATGRAQENRYLSPDDRHWLVRISPWVHAGEARGLICNVTDQTHYQKLQSQLFQSQKMEIIGTLAAGVAHDFNNLLAAIIANAEMLKSKPAGRRIDERRVAMILQTAERGADLVRRLLAFSRKQELVPALVDLNQVIHGMRDLLRATCGRGTRLKTVLDEALWPALIDPVQLEHLILNLVINARDAMPDGGKLIIATANSTLRSGDAATDLAPGDYVVLTVTDTGAGMNEDVLHNAFEPFFTTKPPGQGSGLGLSQVYGLATQSGGSVRIDSSEGKGTRVVVLFPRAPEMAAHETRSSGQSTSQIV